MAAVLTMPTTPPAAPSAGVNVVIDPSLAARQVVLNLKLSAVTAQSALSWAAKAGNFKVRYVEDAVMLTDKEIADSTPRLAMYDVSDLIAVPQDFSSPLASSTYLPLSSSGGAAGAQAPNLFGGGSGAAPAGGDTPEMRLQKIEEQIKKMIEARQGSNP